MLVHNQPVQSTTVVGAPPSERTFVVIVGGGFAGLAAAHALQHADAEVILIDRRNHHIFQPLLYHVATAILFSAEIAAPIRQPEANSKMPAYCWRRLSALTYASPTIEASSTRGFSTWLERALVHILSLPQLNGCACKASDSGHIYRLAQLASYPPSRQRLIEPPHCVRSLREWQFTTIIIGCREGRNVSH
jgi:hypothetical protein